MGYYQSKAEIASTLDSAICLILCTAIDITR